MLNRIALLVVLYLFMLSLIGCGGGKSNLVGDGLSDAKLAAVNNGTSGIQGTALAGPISPVARPGEPDEAPLPDALIIAKRCRKKKGGSDDRCDEGREVARTRTDEDGKFRINLAPGRYLLVARSPQPNSRFPHPPDPMTLRVREGRFKDVTLHYDTGIR